MGKLNGTNGMDGTNVDEPDKQFLAVLGAWLYSENGFCQGPWSVDLRTPRGQECSNGSLLHFRRGVPGILNFI